MFTREFTVKEWQSMPVYAQPNTLHGRQRIDGDGNIWEWVLGNKRVTVKKVRFEDD